MPLATTAPDAGGVAGIGVIIITRSESPTRPPIPLLEVTITRSDCANGYRVRGERGVKELRARAWRANVVQPNRARAGVGAGAGTWRARGYCARGAAVRIQIAWALVGVGNCAPGIRRRAALARERQRRARGRGKEAGIRREREGK